VKLNLSGFTAFCGQLRIPSKEHGLVPMRLWQTQQHAMREIARGLERGVHEYVILAGRQVGKSTLSDALDLWWPQTYRGTVGMLASNDDDNRDFRRDLLLQMLDSLPKDYRFLPRINNRVMLAWPEVVGGKKSGPNSRLMFASAAKRNAFGRSRGLNYLHADEVSSWPNADTNISALRSALAERHPRRLFIWSSTANGYDAFRDLWLTATTAISQRAIFLAWWMHELYRLERETQRALWQVYAEPAPTRDESQWITAIKKDYHVTITPAQLGWYRWKLVESFRGDETMRAQEYPCLPSDAFQSFGDRFLAIPLAQRTMLEVEQQPAPTGFVYRWARTLDESAVEPAAPHAAPLRIWEPPDPDGVYVVAGHPSWSSAPDSLQCVAQVWRVWPDHIAQVSEYAVDQVAMYQFAWACVALVGQYRTAIPPYFILETGATGYRVSQEIQLLGQHGYGLSPQARERGAQNLIGNVQRYFYVRPDSVYATTSLIDWKTSPDNRPRLLHGLRDTLERGHMTIRSRELVEELSALRRGGQDGNNDRISTGGAVSDSRAVCAALAVEVWQNRAMGDLISMVTRKTPDPRQPRTVAETLVRGFLRQRGLAVTA